MEKLIIDIPADKSQLVKDLMKALGVKVTEFPSKGKVGKEVLAQISVWTEEEIKAINEVSKSLNLSIGEW